jgi:hypothetical protein
MQSVAWKAYVRLPSSTLASQSLLGLLGNIGRNQTIADASGAAPPLPQSGHSFIKAQFRTRSLRVASVKVAAAFAHN